MPGYSGTPLPKKLGYKSGYRCMLDGPPAEYHAWLQPLPEDISFLTRNGRGLDLVHVFASRASILGRKLAIYRERIASNGMIWASWPKKASGVETDITEDGIRTLALPLGLVDVKVCAVSDVWSGLKLVIRRENRR